MILLLESLDLNGDLPKGIPIYVYCPVSIQELLRQSRVSKLIELCETPEVKAKGWDLKPHLLLELLSKHEEVVWIDSDIIVTGPISSLLPPNLAAETLVLAQEPTIAQHNGGSKRTELWGFPVGRRLQYSINSGFIRCTRRHLALLEQWAILLRTSEYRNEQLLPVTKRRIHLLSDQEVLSALLGSESYSNIPIHFIRSGTHIAQLYGAAGYGFVNRLRYLVYRNPPILVHAMGKKPWRHIKTPSIIRKPLDYYYHLISETSPYTLLASKLWASSQREPAPWMIRSSRVGSMLRFMFRGDPFLTALPVSMMDWLVRRAKRLLNLDEIPLSRPALPPRRHS